MTGVDPKGLTEATEAVQAWLDWCDRNGEAPDARSGATVAIEAHLAALSPTAPELLPVKVNLLEWRKKSARNYYATTILGTYGAADALGTAAAGLTHILPPAWIDPAGAHHEVDSVETAKVAAQADFEARILSALVRRATHIDQPQTDDMQPDTYTGGDFNGVVRRKKP